MKIKRTKCTANIFYELAEIKIKIKNFAFFNMVWYSIFLIKYFWWEKMGKFIFYF